ncbi:hypothetical protein KAX17_18175 [Candidatus Bipolaricaulota bacterium]|nr:hypothetical protein [Candidatus Bipolaricaulota bacterium]
MNKRTVFIAVLLIGVGLMLGCGGKKTVTIGLEETIPPECYEISLLSGDKRIDPVSDQCEMSIRGILTARVDLPMKLVIKVAWYDSYGKLLKEAVNRHFSGQRAESRSLKKGERWEFLVEGHLSERYFNRIAHFDVVEVYSSKFNKTAYTITLP